MDAVRVVALLIYAFGAFAFGALSVLHTRQYIRSRWPGSSEESPCWASFAMVLLSFVCLVWFLINLVLLLAPLTPNLDTAPLLAIFIGTVFLFPPLLMHVVWAEARDSVSGRGWGFAVLAMWVVSQPVPVLGILLFMGWIEPPTWMPALDLGIMINSLFALAGIYSVTLLVKSRRRGESARRRGSRKSYTWLFGLVVVVALFALFANLDLFPIGEFIDLIVLRSLPLAFLLVGSYVDNRFEFFDLFVKRGASMFVTVLAVAACMALVLPWLMVLELGSAAPWVWAVILLPVVATVPFIHRKLGQWLDNVWLGRRFTAVEAVKHFLASMKISTSERQLVENAESGISEVFRAPTRIDVDLREAAPLEFKEALEVPIRSDRRSLGVVRLGPRANNMPYFSEDVALLGSLAEVFAYTLENVRLQRKKQEQEERARELSLHASRSELKALRAQINPHFLFNALNAIAGLIHKDPLRADRAVEQLAEVFRYTLRRSESEWALLEDELELARAYLEVQQARFGPRLEFEIRSDRAVNAMRIPTMMVQTLVENAVKHGVSSARGPGRIEILAARDGDRLRITVADSGPGFPDGDRPREPGAGDIDTGYGLRNIRERLRGHFDEAARLEADRDPDREMTVVALELPISGLPTYADDAAGGGRGTPAG
jgi:signal transduction histidine kinase